jgi:hypothetical protein
MKNFRMYQRRTPLLEACSGFQEAACDYVPKAACDSENCSESRLCHVHRRKFTNGSEEKPEQKF